MPKSNTDYDRWTTEAAALGQVSNPLKVPYNTALSEAGIAASFVFKYWEPAGDRPGLKRIKKRLPKSTGDDITSLVRATQEAQTRLLLIVDPVMIDRGEQGRAVVEELEAALEFLLDDDVDEPADAQLANLKEFHAQDGERSNALGQALLDYGTLAKQLRDRLVEDDEAFEPAWIDEALKLSAELAKETAPSTATSADAKAATLIRNQFLTLLTKKIGLVRKGAARVFNKHPDIVREVSSAYERRRRAANRRVAAKKGAEGGAPVGENKDK